MLVFLEKVLPLAGGPFAVREARLPADPRFGPWLVVSIGVCDTERHGDSSLYVHNHLNRRRRP